MTFTTRLISRMEPWNTGPKVGGKTDLERYLASLGAMFEPVLALCEETGIDGEGGSQGTNMVSNSSFEGGVQGWINSAPRIYPNVSTIRRVITQAFSGKASLEMVATEPAQGTTVLVKGPFISGRTYNASVYLKGPPVEVALYMNASATDGNALGAIALTESWQRAELNWKPKSTFETAAVVITPQNAVPTTVFIDAVMVIEGTVAIPYQPERIFIPAWGNLMAPETCPPTGLPFLAQFVGVELREGMTEVEQRAAIKAEAGFARGTPVSLKALLKKALGTTPFLFLERTKSVEGDDAYWLTVVIPKGSIPAAMYEEINATIPAGIWYTIVERAGTWFSGTLKWSGIAAGKKWSELVEGTF